MATTKIINDLIDLNQTGNTTALKGCVGTNAQQPTVPTISVQYLVVGGGGAAGGGSSGGGGAGGLSTGTIAVPNNTAVNIVIGQGGVATTYSASSQPNGQDSGFYTIQGQGGGAGRYRNTGQPGGSGGGGGNDNPAVLIAGGNSVSGQGNNGGSSTTAQTYITGGGGGAGAVGDNASAGTSGNGGTGSDAVALGIITQANGITANIGEVNGATLNFAGGGGGGGSFNGTGLKGSGGLGGGGDGSQADGVIGSSGTANTGGGAGGGHLGAVDSMGGNGGSGVVILRYASSTTETIAATSGGFLSGDGLDTVSTCNYPTTATALYQFEDTPDATCGPNPTTTATLTYVTGKFGKAVDFNGTNSVWQSTNQIINSQSSFSISMWVKIDAYSSPDTGYLWTSYATGDWSINLGGTGFKYFRFAKWNDTQPGTYVEVANPSVSALSQWYHVCGTFSTTTGMVLYVDGTSVGSDSTTWTGKNHGAYSDSIGCYGYTPSGNRADFDGQIDQFRAFQSALTSAQVEALYSEGITTKFTEGSGATEKTVLVFKGGSGTINLIGSSVLGPKVGDLRTNTDQTSTNSAASAMEHYISTGWRVFDNAPPVALENFNTVLYTGNGVSGNSITGVGFQPDMVWVKATDATYDPVLASVVNTQDYYLTTSETYIESVGNGRFSSFDTDGFTVTDGTSASNPAVINNKASTNYVSWNWKAGGPAVSNGNGSITTQVSANVNAGFSVISYTGNNTAGATVPHGLNALPELIIWKGATHVSGWKVYCNQFSSPTTEIIELYLSGGVSTNTTFIDGTAPGLEFITLGAYGDTNSLGNTMIAYCFHSVAGYSKIGSYTGNGSTTGPIVTTGFEPAFLMIKITTGSDSWFMIDNKRSTTNPRGNRLFADTSAAEASEPGAQVNFNATGFQLTGSGGGQGQTNSSGSGYMYLAIA